MIEKRKKIKILFLKNLIKKNKNFEKKKILKSIIQNNQIFQEKKIFASLLNNKNFFKKSKKNCLFGISNKWITRKSNFSRFAVHKINFSNLNQNFKINEN